MACQKWASAAPARADGDPRIEQLPGRLDRTSTSTPPPIQGLLTEQPQPRRDLNREARIQAAVVEWARVVPPELLIFAIPNGGLRSKAEAARMKWTGIHPAQPRRFQSLIGTIGSTGFCGAQSASRRSSGRPAYEQATIHCRPHGTAICGYPSKSVGTCRLLGRF
jgi:hypothetical protein